MLKDVVVSADSHELLVERAPSLALLAGEWESGNPDPKPKPKP